ncbi:hypothetical protein Tco_0004588 [Tanacetum coccineum]
MQLKPRNRPLMKTLQEQFCFFDNLSLQVITPRNCIPTVVAFVYSRHPGMTVSEMLLVQSRILGYQESHVNGTL